MKWHLDRLAKEHGISLTRPSPDNVEVPISDETKRTILLRWALMKNPLLGR